MIEIFKQGLELRLGEGQIQLELRTYEAQFESVEKFKLGSEYFHVDEQLSFSEFSFFTFWSISM